MSFVPDFFLSRKESPSSRLFFPTLRFPFTEISPPLTHTPQTCFNSCCTGYRYSPTTQRRNTTHPDRHTVNHTVHWLLKTWVEASHRTPHTDLDRPQSLRPLTNTFGSPGPGIPSSRVSGGRGGLTVDDTPDPTTFVSTWVSDSHFLLSRESTDTGLSRWRGPFGSLFISI